MDANEVADFIKSHGASAWLQSVGGIEANYPTKFDFHYQNPITAERESGDLIQDSFDAARARGLRFLGRMDFSKVQGYIAEEHPDWVYISPNNTWQNHTNGVVSVCPSGEWYQERVFDILDEVMTRYPLDGFFVNWAGMNERDYFRVYHGVCHCQACQRGWSEYSGNKTLPHGPWSDNYDEWKIFSDGIIDKWTVKVREFIAERLPNAGLILGSGADIMFYEANNAVDREIWHHATSQEVSRVISWRPDVPVLVNSASFLDHAYRFAPENINHYSQFHLQAMARGANPSTYIIGIPGKIPWPGLSIAGELMRFHASHRDVYSGMRPSSKTGLVLPRNTQMNETEYEAAMSEYKGMYKALQELHIPFDVVALQYLPQIAENGGFDRYDVLILPNIPQLLPDDAETLDEWVAEGGTLIASGVVGVDDDGAVQLQSLPSSRRIEFHEDFQSMWSMYFAPEQNRTEENYYEGPLIPLLGSYGEYEWKEGSEGRFKKLDYAPFAPPEYIYGNVQIDERGAGVGSYENGTGVLVPFPLGSGYRETGLDVFRQFFELLIDEFGAEERVAFDLSEQVEVTLNTNGRNQTVVHLVNMSGIKYQNFGEPLPIPAGSMRILGSTDGVAARTLFSGVELEIESDGTVQLPGLDLFDVIVIDGLE